MTLVPPEAETAVAIVPPAPRLNSIFILGKDQTLEDVPKPKLPFFVLSEEGFYKRRWITLGTGTIRQTKIPSGLGKLGNYSGFFNWDAPVVPPEICAQVVDFFRRIWDKHKAEAEVILTAKVAMIEGRPTIQEWRVFVPTQRVSSGGVESVFEPTHIAKDHLVVGTMHSHCNFSAFHSGTDEADARNMDGLHITIGHVDKKEPQVVAMVSVDGQHVNYNGKDLAQVADFSNLDAAKAPEWWDQYVIPTKNLISTHKPVGYGNFTKYEPTKTHTGWNGGSSSAYSGYGGNRGYEDGYYGYSRPPITPRQNEKPEQKEPQSKKLGDLVADSKDDDTLLPDDTGGRSAFGWAEMSDKEWIAYLKEREGVYWEDNLDSKLRDALFKANVITEADMFDFDKLNQDQVEDLNPYLRTLMLTKMRGIKKVMTLLGIDMKCVLEGINPELASKFKEERSTPRLSKPQTRTKKKGPVVNNGNSKRRRFSGR